METAVMWRVLSRFSRYCAAGSFNHSSYLCDYKNLHLMGVFPGCLYLADVCTCFRWTRACRRGWRQGWSWRCACDQSPTALTGWLTSSPHVASCCCCGMRATRTTGAPTSGATSWRQTSTRWAGAASMARPWERQRVRRGCLQISQNLCFFFSFDCLQRAYMQYELNN